MRIYMHPALLLKVVLVCLVLGVLCGTVLFR